MTNTQNQIHRYYENIEFNLPTGNTDYDVAANQATFMSNFGPLNVVSQNPTALVVRTNQTISIKLNATTNHAITIASTDSPYVIKGVEYNKIFITNNSGSTAAIKLFVSSVEN